MTFYAFGLNHEQATVDLRERFALDEAAIRSMYQTVPLTPEAEYIVLSTCNRTEVYLCGRLTDVHSLKAHMSECAGRPWPEEQAFLVDDEQAIRHVLHVAAGIKSMVLGDAQIFAQLKDAYRVAVEEDGIGTIMHRLMHTAFRAAKQVATETNLSSGASSVSSAAAVLAREHFDGVIDEALAGYRATLIGVGQMGRLALEALRAHDLTDLTIVNRTVETARELAASTEATVVAWEDRYDTLATADVVLVATGAHEPVLRADAMPRRLVASACLIIDIAVPRNVDPAINRLPGYRVVDMDALDVWIHGVVEKRRAEIPAAEAICDAFVEEFVSWVFHQQALQPAIQAIRDTFEAIRVQEIERNRHRFVEADRAELDRLTGSILQKLLAVPVVRLKSVEPGSIDFVRGIKLLSTLFSRPGCDDASESEQQAQPQAGTEADQDAEVVNSPAACPFDTHSGRGA